MRRIPLWLMPPIMFAAAIATVVVMSWTVWVEPIDWRLAVKVATIAALASTIVALMRWVVRLLHRPHLD